MEQVVNINRNTHLSRSYVYNLRIQTPSVGKANLNTRCVIAFFWSVKETYIQRISAKFHALI